MKQRTIRHVVVLQPEGQLVGDDETAALEAALQQLYDRGQYRVIIDLSRIGTFNSTGIGRLLIWHVRLANREGRLVLALVPSRLLSFFHRAGLERALTIRHGLVEAAHAAEGFDLSTT